MGTRRRKKKQSEQRAELSKKSAEIIKIVVGVVVGIIVVVIVVGALWMYSKKPKKQEIQGQQGQETIISADIVIASDGHVTKLNTPPIAQNVKVMQLKKTDSFRV
jgi:flagellar basal body-associated protein FliL